MPTTDLLILAISRQPGGLTVAGMTTERDPKTGLRWVRLVPADEPLQLDALRYADGTLARPGDVVRLQIGEAQPASPQVENVTVELDEPLERVRQLPDERRTAFFEEHLDLAPTEVLGGRQRSLCLVRPDSMTATVKYDEETDHFDTTFAVKILSGQVKEDGTPKYLRSREDIIVTDIYWRALMRDWLVEDDSLMFNEAELRKRLGEIYLVIGLSPKGGPRILGVHSVPAYDATIDPENL